MILTYSIYAILALFILIGFKFSGFKEFNDDFLMKMYQNQLED